MGESRRHRNAAQVSALFEAAISHHRSGRLDDAERAYVEVLARVPDHCGALNMRGAVALVRGDPTAALGYLDLAVSADGKVAGVHLNRGNALRALGRLADARASYERALALDPNMAAAHINRGNVLRDGGVLDLAEAGYRTALALVPTSFAAAANLAAVIAAQPDRAEASLAAYAAALDLAEAQGLRGPDVANCHNALGNLYRSGGRLEEALECFAKAIDLDPLFAQAHANLSRALAAAARHEEAVVAIRRAVELQPEVDTHLEVLALQLRRLGRHDQAAAAYQRWIDKDPDNPIAAHMHRALTGGAVPESATVEYVRREFDGFAANFDEVLRTRLEYCAPELLLGAVRAVLGDVASRLTVADLGCGTGLCPPLFRTLAARLVGVDLSPRMLEIAVTRGYDELVEGEIAAYCSAHPGEFDLLVAADVLIYVGTLDRTLQAARCSLRPAGHLAFTVERGDEGGPGYALNAGGRYTHTHAYVTRSLELSGFTVLAVTTAPLRTELGVPVLGLVVVARAC